MTELREKFAEKFGEDQTLALEMAGMTHFEVDPDANISGKGYGSDPFRTALVFAIAFDCYYPKYSEFHGINLDPVEVEDWIKENVDLTKHDGAFDQLSVAAGIYDKFVSA